MRTLRRTARPSWSTILSRRALPQPPPQRSERRAAPAGLLSPRPVDQGTNMEPLLKSLQQFDHAEEGIAALAPWFHNLHLPDGSQTAPNHPLGDFPCFKWEQISESVPERLEDWTALDIGCNAGFY